jgi:hypothetical protein
MQTTHNTKIKRDEATQIPESVRQLNRGLTADLLGGLIDVEGFDNGGETVKGFAHTGVPLLDSFYFRFLHQDHHLQMVRIDPDTPAGQMTLAYQDANEDDDYFYHIKHRIVDDPRVQRAFAQDIGTEVDNAVQLQRPAGDFVFVLIGFTFRFTGDRDHHIREVRILEFDSILHVRFRDENNNPPSHPRPVFLWDVQFAWVPRDLFVELGSESGADVGDAGRNIPAGPSVIRGFGFNFQSKDRHLKEIGVFTPDDNSRVEVYYGDKNVEQEDIFDWIVDWGVLTP